MSETPDSPSAHASLCFDPTLALRQPLLAESEPVTPLSTDAHADTPTTEQTMGNQQSGEGSLRRRSKKKSKKDDKGKVGIASALFSDPVLGASGVGGYGGTSVDDAAATPSKRKRQAEQTKSPRPIRSTYDNVNQSGSITSLCDASEMYTSDLFLDTVSRLDVSMTPSQAEIAGIRHHFDPQAIDNLSYGGSSLAESGFITPALATPQVQRNQLAGAMTTSDSVTELGKEIERTIVERLSANQKAGNTDAQPEASVSSSPKSNEVKMTLVMRSPIPPRKAVTEVKLSGASPRTAKLEIIDSNQEILNKDTEGTEPKPLKPLVESKIEIDLGSEQPGLEEDGRKPEISDGTDKADNELMEKECKTDEMKQGKNPDDAPGKRVETKEKHKELDVNLISSSSDENCGDFEKVKLHIEEEDLLVAKNQDEKNTSSNVIVEASADQVTEAGHATKIADESSDHNPAPSVTAAGQQSTLVKEDVPEPENVSEEVVVGEKYVQREPTDKEEKTEKTSVGARRRRERPKAETPKEEKKEKTEREHREMVEKTESVLTSQAPLSKRDEVKESASTDTTVAAAAVVATEPLESTVRTVVMPKVSEKTDDNVSVVDTPKAACEELIQATEFASVEQAHVIMRRPVFQHDDQGLCDIKKEERETEICPESKSGPGLNLEPEMDDKNSKTNSKEKSKKPTEEKEQTSIAPSEQKVSTQTDESLRKEQSLSEAKKAVASTSNTDDIPITTSTTKINKEDPPKEKSADEKPSGVVSPKTTKPKKDRKRKRKRGKQQPTDDVTTTEAETKETTSGREDVPQTTKEVDETVSSKEDTEKSTTDDSGDSSSTAFNKHSLQQQVTIIERTGFQKDGDQEKGEADDRPVDACDLFLQSEEFRKQETCESETPEILRSPPQRRENPFVAIETNLTVDSPANSEILSDEPTPTNDRSNQLRAFYMPDRSQKNRAKLFCVADSERGRENESANDMAEQGEQRDEIQRQSSDSEIKPSGSPPTLEDKSNSENESIDNAVVEDSPEGTKAKTEQKRSLRISLTSEEVSEILQNSQTILNGRPLSHNQETEDEVKNIMTGSDRKEDENDEETMDDAGHHKKHTKNISNLTLSDIDSSLPETLPELADLQNFLEYIKIGEQPAEGETPPFSPRGETGRSSPNENSNSRRLSRISPAVTERSVTESDLDISEQRDDLSTDSNIFADDEDESSSELLFTKTYTEPEKGGEVCVSCTVVNTNADDDSDEFWAENSATEEVYRRIETSTKAVTTVFDNARLQMQDIHTHLHNLRLQMENLQDSLDNASILSQEYYNMDNDQVTSQEFYSLEKGLLVSQEYFSRSRKAPATTEEYSPVDIGPVLTEEYYSSTLGKPPLL